MKTDDPMRYARMPLRIAYCRDTDRLEIRNGERIHSGYAVARGLIVHLDADGETAGFTLEKARELLLLRLSEYDAASTKLRLQERPVPVSPEEFYEGRRKAPGKNSQSALNIGYCPEYDTLDIWNEKGAGFGWNVGANLIAFSKDEDGKELNGFTLECAAQLLLPRLQNTDCESVPSWPGG